MGGELQFNISVWHQFCIYMHNTVYYVVKLEVIILILLEV